MAIRSVAISAIADDVYRGLTATPKSLPPKLFYDAEGSELFEEITRLPEYYLTRTELAILRERANEIARRTPARASIVELGAGSAAKTRTILQALADRRMQVHYYPVDISSTALKGATAALRRELPSVRISPTCADLGGDLRFLRDVPAPRVVLYIGSSIGNMEPEEAADFLLRVRRRLAPGDAFLLGADLVKDRHTLVAAYDDAAGVTAQFNLNLLARINRELGGHFDLRTFRHIALWNAKQHRMEIYLESEIEQQIRIDALGLSIRFDAGEWIHTENSHKYTVAGVRRMLRNAGFTPRAVWTDPKKWFSVHWAVVP
ncbi:MAG: L-histidine N(alpha)-methyltransferase [Terriglobales bacterium]